MRILPEQAFLRAAGAPLIAGNSVRVLKDAAENYPAWLEAIEAAERRIHFESYIPLCFESMLGPFDLLNRDHRKMLAVDGQVGFVTGLCVGQMCAALAESGRARPQST